jgi:hypothetical protein
LLGRHQDAQAAYRQAIGIDATMTGVQVNLALSLAMAGRAGDAAPLLRPLASGPDAPRRLRHNLAAVLAMAGDRGEAQSILAKDLPPEEVDRALAIFLTATTSPAAAHPVDAAAVAMTVPEAGTPPSGSPSGGSATGSLMVELSRQATSAAAEAAWLRLQHQMPDLMAGRQPILLRSDSAGRVQWRVRAAGFAGPQQAEAFCRAVEARGSTCAVTGS